MKKLHTQRRHGIEAFYDCFQGKHWRKDFRRLNNFRKDRGPGARGCTKSGLLRAFMVLIFEAWRIMVNWETIISVNEKGERSFVSWCLPGQTFLFLILKQ